MKMKEDRGESLPRTTTSVNSMEDDNNESVEITNNMNNISCSSSTTAAAAVAPRPSTNSRWHSKSWFIRVGMVVALCFVVAAAVLVGVVLSQNRQQDKREQAAAAAARQSLNSNDTTATNNNKNNDPVVLVDIKIKSPTVAPARAGANSTTTASQNTTTTTANNSNTNNSSNSAATTTTTTTNTMRPTTTLAPSVLRSFPTTDTPIVNNNNNAIPTRTINTLAPTATETGTAVPTLSTSTIQPTTFPPLVRPVQSAGNSPLVTTFYVHGDIPYNASQAVVLEEQMRSVPSDAEFVVFVGDLRPAGPDLPCTAAEYQAAAALFRLSHAPVFVLIGDNDWSDCPNVDQGLQLWRDEFVGFEHKHWGANLYPFAIQRHSDGAYPENFSFVHKQTLFVGVNIIGGDVHDSTEWRTRLTTESTWTMDVIRAYHAQQQSTSQVGRVVIFGHANPNERHGSFFRPLTSFIADELQNTLPIVYICGDKHEWYYEPSYNGQASWLRIMVTGLGEEPLLKVSIAPTGVYENPESAFVIDRRL